MILSDIKLGIIGLGYVGLPLAVEFGKSRSVLGFDINIDRIQELISGIDNTLEVESRDLAEARFLRFSSEAHELEGCNFYIVTVPTPIDNFKKPDLSPLISASKIIGENLSVGDIVVYESTVYPGATEEICVPVLEEASGLVYNKEFYVGYSPERINPGDKKHRLQNIVKVTSGSLPKIANLVDELYKQIVTAGTHKAESISVAEASKVIENTQRDVNIALINELSIIFNKLGIDTEAVLKAASTKWNFLPFKPGLVGGHCIGVDPYYLTHKAESIGYHPEIILAGRRLNDSMGAYVATQLLKTMSRKRIAVFDSKILILGFSFKEDCPDLRNTKIVDIVRELEGFNAAVDVYDPWIDIDEAKAEYGITPVTRPDIGVYDAVIIAVAHRQFKLLGASGIHKYGKSRHVLYDLKHILDIDQSDIRL